MKVKAEAKFIRTNPRKIRLIADLVRSMKPEEALIVLKNMPQRAAITFSKVLKQAIANSVNNHNLPKDGLKIHSIEVNQASTYKRWNPVSRGRAHAIQKKTSHIKIILEGEKTKKPASTRKEESTSRGGPAKISKSEEVKTKK